MHNDGVIMSSKIVLIIANSVAPDEMQHDAAFHLGLQCLSMYPFGVSSIPSVKLGSFKLNHLKPLFMQKMINYQILTGKAAIKNVNTIDECRSKIVRNSFRLLVVAQPATNGKRKHFFYRILYPFSSFVKSVFHCRLTGVRLLAKIDF